MDRPPLYAGIAGVQLPCDAFELGGGVQLVHAAAHVVRPFLIAHSNPDSSFPAVMNASGSFGFDIVAQIGIPEGFAMTEWFDLPNTVWWLAALLRLRATPRLRIPILSNVSFSKVGYSTGQRYWSTDAEAERTTLILDPEASNVVSIESLEWVRDRWRRAGVLMRANRQFNVLFQAFDQSAYARDPMLALLLMWSALEAMFSPARTELRFRVATTIACFLEPPGDARAKLQRNYAKLYDARSAATHGNPEVAQKPLTETYLLLKRVILRIIDADRVPKPSELEDALFHGR